MKFMTKVEWVFECDDFLMKSKDASRQMKSSESKKGKSLTQQDKDNIIGKRLKRKLKNPYAVKGVCNCTEGVLCKHRISYLKELF